VEFPLRYWTQRPKNESATGMNGDCLNETVRPRKPARALASNRESDCPAALFDRLGEGCRRVDHIVTTVRCGHDSDNPIDFLGDSRLSHANDVG
jgi:hypothetical protein